jgi:intracellular septation protein A
MLALGLVLNTVGLGLFCWLIFALAVYAVPFFVAVSIGMLTLNSGAGVVGALLVGIIAGALTLVLSQTAFAMTRSTILRGAIGAAFAVPAAIAGYHVVLAMSQVGVPSLAWREVFACLGAVSVGATAWIQLTLFAEPRPLVRIGA